MNSTATTTNAPPTTISVPSVTATTFTNLLRTRLRRRPTLSISGGAECRPLARPPREEGFETAPASTATRTPRTRRSSEGAAAPRGSGGASTRGAPAARSDPRLSEADFRLSAGSPAINAGAPELAPAVDFEKKNGWENYVGPELDSYKAEYRSAKAGNFFWTGVSFAGIAYNTEKVTGADIPKTWKDINDAKWRNAISCKISASGVQYVAWYTLGKIYGFDFWKEFAKQKPKAFDSRTQLFDRQRGSELAPLPRSGELAGQLVDEVRHVARRIRQVVGAADVQRKHLRQQTRVPDPGVLLGDRLVHAGEQRAQRGRRFAHMRDAPRDARAHPRRELDQHVVLGREVEVEGPAGHPRGSGDPIDLGRRHTDRSELAQRDLEDPLAGVLALTGPHTARLGGSRRRVPIGGRRRNRRGTSLPGSDQYAIHRRESKRPTCGRHRQEGRQAPEPAVESGSGMGGPASVRGRGDGQRATPAAPADQFCSSPSRPGVPSEMARRMR